MHLNDGEYKEIAHDIHRIEISSLVINSDKNMPFGEFPEFGK